MNLYLYAVLENASEDTKNRLEQALEPPRTYRVKGAPAWYGDDDEAWEAFEVALRKR